MPARTFSDKYRLPIRFACMWALLVMVWCGLVLDMGESFITFLYSLGTYIGLVIVVIFRRPILPTNADLLIIKWGLPVLFFFGLSFYPFVWHLRGAY
jgi:hypothetical protein